MSGNSLNLCMKIGGGDFADVPLLLAAIGTYFTGYSVWKALNVKLEGRRSCSTVAPVVLAMFTAADVARHRFPLTRWHLLLLTVPCGMINAISNIKGEIVTNMVSLLFVSLFPSV